MNGLDQLGLRNEFRNGAGKLDGCVLDTLDAVAAFDLTDTLDAVVAEGELDAAQAETAGIEFKRFLALTVLAKHDVAGVDRSKLAPSPMVDAVWHECLEDEAAYRAMCANVLGFSVGHGVDHDAPKKAPPSEPMEGMLDLFFSEYSTQAWAGRLAPCWPVLS